MHNVNVKQLQEGSNGGQYIGDTSAVTGNFSRIVALESTTFTTLTGNLTGAASMTLPANGSITGHFTAITLASGSVIAYNN